MTSTNKSPYRPGSVIRVRVGEREIDAEIIEDLGPIAPGAKHVLRLKSLKWNLTEDGWDTFDFTVPNEIDDRIRMEVETAKQKCTDLFNQWMRSIEDFQAIGKRYAGLHNHAEGADSRGCGLCDLLDQWRV